MKKFKPILYKKSDNNFNHISVFTDDISDFELKTKGIYIAFDKYKKYFLDKKLRFTYVKKNNEKFHIDVHGTSKHFLHLCGVFLYDPYFININSIEPQTFKVKNAEKFFKDCEKQKLKLNSMWFTGDETILDRPDYSYGKLKVMGKMEKFFTKDVTAVGSGLYSKLSYNSGLRTKENIGAIVFDFDKQGEGDAEFPISVISFTEPADEKSKTKSFTLTYPVIMIEEFVNEEYIVLHDFSLSPKDLETLKRNRNSKKKQKKEKAKLRKEKDRLNSQQQKNNKERASHPRG